MSLKQKKLNQLQKKMEAEDLPLKEDANLIVFGEGSENAKVMFIGEAPGKNEDLQGRPFVGSAGKKLEALLEKAGLTREEVYITSIIKYRPPKNRNPNMQELRAHSPYLVKQIELIRPRILATLGNFSTRFVLNGFSLEKMNLVPGISQIHGEEQSLEWGKHECLVFPLYHPAAILYNPPLREVVEKDFSYLGRLLQNIGGESCH